MMEKNKVKKQQTGFFLQKRFSASKWLGKTLNSLLLNAFKTAAANHTGETLNRGARYMKQQAMLIKTRSHFSGKVRFPTSV